MYLLIVTLYVIIKIGIKIIKDSVCKDGTKNDKLIYFTEKIVYVIGQKTTLICRSSEWGEDFCCLTVKIIIY